jgi:hypothetical protein
MLLFVREMIGLERDNMINKPDIERSRNERRTSTGSVASMAGSTNNFDKLSTPTLGSLNG